MIWMLVHLFILKKFFLCHCQMLIITLMDFDDSSSDFSLPPDGLNTASFPSQDPLDCPQVSGSTGLPPGGQLLSRRVEVISIRDFANSVNVLKSNLIFQRSCLFKSNCWNEIKEMLVLEIFLKIKFFQSKIQHMLFKICNPLIVLYFENRNDLL
jgi:hypothetical protein